MGSSMGAVHGVVLKYVFASAICGTGAIATQSRIARPLLAWCAGQHALIACLFVARKGMWVIGKDATTGQIPLWSYLLWAPFHLPTACYTWLHTRLGARSHAVPVASEVAPGWYIGGSYSHELGKRFAGVVDLTCEFPE